AMIAVAVSLVTAVITIVGGRFLIRYNYILMELRGRFYGLVVQLLGAVSKIRAAGAQRRVFALWANRYADQLDYVMRLERISDYIFIINSVIGPLASALIFLSAVSMLNQTVEGEPSLTLGTFLAFNAALGIYLGGVASLSNTVVDLLDTFIKVRRVKPLLEAEQEIDYDKNDPGRLRGAIGLDRVTFRYGDDGPIVLNDVSIRVEPGEYVALVGPSGSGKSTLFRLLLGFEKAETGIVTYDNKDLRNLNVAAVRRQIGTVLQSAQITTGGIFENIAAGANVSLDDAWSAAKDAGFGAEIKQMPMGMHTVVSEGGANLSGGQRQRLLIARALVKQPRVLLFDEATSALDNKTQAVVSASLQRKRITRIAIAHRLSTVADADRIYVLDKGRVIQSGSYAELAETEGLFAQMLARQLA
ncbi:MAG: ATP-binding cassette domain-containing protein, partial [Gammaproteobacteria bacterium]|nr:ATP-binding cassette domain-containing protein [Gammaproteobacteria bacterium]